MQKSPPTRPNLTVVNRETVPKFVKFVTNLPIEKTKIFGSLWDSLERTPIHLTGFLGLLEANSTAKPEATSLKCWS